MTYLSSGAVFLKSLHNIGTHVDELVPSSARYAVFLADSLPFAIVQSHPGGEWFRLVADFPAGAHAIVERDDVSHLLV